MTRHKIIILILCICVLGQAYGQQQEEEKTRPKVAVVLSGGGAKGCAHIGALKVIEKAGIPIDIVCGTSMGALIGGLYSIGYSPQMLDSLVRVQDWTFLLSDKIDPKSQTLPDREKQNIYLFSVDLNDLTTMSLNKQGVIKGKNLADLFSLLTIGYHDSISFDSLPIRFSCVATDMVKYDELDWHSGRLSTAMRSSMSIPGVFSPVKIDSMVLVDGGLHNNFPTDLAKQMGADIIIGVSVQALKQNTAEDFKNTFSLLNKLMDVNTENKMSNNLLLTDVFIKVNVDGYSAASFNAPAIDTLIRRGEDAAMQQWDNLLALKSLLDTDELYQPKPIEPYHILNKDSKVFVENVNFSNITHSDERYLIKKFDLNHSDSISIGQIENAVTALKGNLFYNDATYHLNNTGKGYNLSIESEGKKAAQMFFGVRFDNEEKVSMQFHAQAPFQFLVPIVVQATGRLGKRSLAQVQATFNTSSIAALTVGYNIRHHDINIYYKGNRDYNVAANQHQVNFGSLNQGIKNFLFDVFLRWDYLYYQSTLSEMRSNKKNVILAPHFYSYHARIHFNSLDNQYFATSGAQIEGQYALYTDNFYSYKGGSPFQVVSALFHAALPFSERLILLPMVYGRSVFGDDVPAFIGNYIGGGFFGQYFEQQMPFAGIGNVEYVDKNFLAMNMNLRQRFLENNYIGVNLSLGLMSEKINALAKHTPLIGANIKYEYNSFIGPVGASVNWSNRTKDVYLFVNLGYQF